MNLFEINIPLLFVIAIIYYLIKFYLNIKTYPPGPTPLPIIGNVLLFYRNSLPTDAVLTKLTEKYGPVVTIWVGFIPIVVIFDHEIAINTFNRSEFAGRHRFKIFEFLSNEKNSGILLDNYGKRWKTLRSITTSAIRKHSASENLPVLVRDVVDETVKSMIDGNACEPFLAYNHIYSIFFQTIFYSLFSDRNTSNGELFSNVKYYLHELFQDIGPKFPVMEFVPLMKYYYRSMYMDFKNTMENIMNGIRINLNTHLNVENENHMPDLCDALIQYKNEAIVSGKESAQYLNDTNICLIFNDLLGAGIDTSVSTFLWILLLLSNYPDVQNKLRKEIDSVIGDRNAVQDDQNLFHYLNAFISESMRLYTAAPIALPHKTLKTTKINNYTIPKDTIILVNQQHIHNDPKLWTDPKNFRPERFLSEDGRYKYTTASMMPYFMPFGTGRRLCPGERLAKYNTFLILVRFLQMTDGYELCLDSGPNSSKFEVKDNVDIIRCPKDFKIFLKKINE